MNYKNLNENVKEQLAGVKWKFAGVLLVLITVNILVQQYLSINNEQTTFFIVLNLFISLALAIIQNTVLFLFIKRVREEQFGMADVKYSCSKILLHISTGVLLALAQSVLQTLVLVVISFVPILADPILILLQTIFLVLTVFVAFAIYDASGNGNGSMFGTIGGSTKLLFRNIKIAMMILLPYILWLLICQLGINVMLNPYITETTKTFGDAIANGIASNSNFLMMYIGLYAVKIIGSCYLCVTLYTGLANIYEFDFLNCYPTMTRRLQTITK